MATSSLDAPVHVTDLRPMSDAIPPTIVAELRAQLRAQVADPTLSDADQGRALRAVCALARQHNIQVEQLLVVLKDTFDRLTPATSLGPSSAADRTARLERLVTLCIRTYYAPAEPT
jgi:hypothetical protein